MIGEIPGDIELLRVFRGEKVRQGVRGSVDFQCEIALKSYPSPRMSG